MVKHNLDAAAAAGTHRQEIEYCVQLVIPYKRSSPRRAAIAEILGEFLVYPVHTRDGLEVTGTRANIEQAGYIAGYLDRALSTAWKRAKWENTGRPLREKPFMAAAAASYVEKLRRAKSGLPKSDRNALVVLTTEIEWATRGAYGGGVHTATTSYQTCGISTSQGARAGRELEIRRGVTTRGTVALLEG